MHTTQNARDRCATSKLCDLLIVRALARRGVDAFAIDPGLMPGTRLARDYGAVARFAWNTILRVAAYVMPGASTAARSGRAYVAHRDDQAEQLYRHCLELAGLRDPF